MDVTLKTDRLTLRPLRLDDAARIQRLCSNFALAKMTARIPHPYPDGLAADWIAGNEESAAEGSAYNFAIDHGSALIGVIGVEQRGSARFEIGYWIGEPWWGRGFASEALKRLVDFAFERLGLEELSAGHFLDNPASGRVLEKCGFRYSGEESEWSKARGCDVACRRFVLKRDWAGAQTKRP